MSWLDNYLHTEELKERMNIQKKAKPRFWTAQEDEFLRVNYWFMETSKLSKLLNRSHSAISGRAFKLGLKKEKQFFNKEGRYKKGNLPWNKGSKGLMTANRTSFKKGHTPKNSHEFGTITELKDKRGVSYKIIKSEIGKEYLHRYLYRTKIGEIKKDHIVIFKDGNPMNLELSNLEQISRAENMRRNKNESKVIETKRQKTLQRIKQQEYLNNCYEHR